MSNLKERLALEDKKDAQLLRNQTLTTKIVREDEINVNECLDSSKKEDLVKRQ